jgi:hypothetical protein
MFKTLFRRRRSEPRRLLDIGTTVHEVGGDALQLRIVSLSARGFRLKGCESFHEGSQLAIMLPGHGEVSGRVVWTAGDECGGIFESPIPIDTLQLGETAV